MDDHPSEPQTEANEMFEDADEFKHFEDMLPKESVPEVAVRAIGYIDEDGETRFSYQIHGDSSNSKVMGIIELAKHQWYHDMHLHQDEEIEDDD
jgi:hypothetical protein